MVSVADNTQPLESRHAFGVTLVLLAGVFWSIGGIVVRLIDAASEWQIVFYRSLALAVMLLIYLTVRKPGAVSSAFRSAGLTAVLAGLSLAAGFICWIFALTHTTVANAMFLLATAPFITAVLARVLIGERIRSVTWFTMSIAVLGVGVMVMEGVASGTLSGNLFALGAALGFAGFTVALRRGKTIDMTPAVCLAGAFAATAAGAMVIYLGHGFPVSTHDAALCIILGVVQVGCGLIIYTIGSRYVAAAELALLSLTEIVLGPIWAWVGVGEIPTKLTLIGGAIVLSAIVGQAFFVVRRRPPVGVV